jgi:tRNA A-37 threonylcarbamoyl transferase component Bud32
LIKHTRRDSKVWLERGKIYKSQPKFLTDNEYYFLKQMEDTGYVPVDVVLEGIELISMEYIKPELVTNTMDFMYHYHHVLWALREKGVHHGDLTKYSLLVRNNKPVIIDFSESRRLDSPIESKRPGADSIWLEEAMREVVKASGI